MRNHTPRVVVANLHNHTLRVVVANFICCYHAGYSFDGITEDTLFMESHRILFSYVHNHAQQELLWLTCMHTLKELSWLTCTHKVEELL